MDPTKDRAGYAKSGLEKSAFLMVVPAWFGKFSELRSYLKAKRAQSSEATTSNLYYF